jgi:hypothetical protein
VADYLTRLIERTLGLAPTVQPAIRPVFVPEPPPETPFPDDPLDSAPETTEDARPIQHPVDSAEPTEESTRITQNAAAGRGVRIDHPSTDVNATSPPSHERAVRPEPPERPRDGDTSSAAGGSTRQAVTLLARITRPFRKKTTPGVAVGGEHPTGVAQQETLHSPSPKEPRQNSAPVRPHTVVPERDTRPAPLGAAVSSRSSTASSGGSKDRRVRPEPAAGHGEATPPSSGSTPTREQPGTVGQPSVPASPRGDGHPAERRSGSSDEPDTARGESPRASNSAQARAGLPQPDGSPEPLHRPAFDAPHKPTADHPRSGLQANAGAAISGQSGSTEPPRVQEESPEIMGRSSKPTDASGHRSATGFQEDPVVPVRSTPTRAAAPLENEVPERQAPHTDERLPPRERVPMWGIKGTPVPDASGISEPSALSRMGQAAKDHAEPGKHPEPNGAAPEAPFAPADTRPSTAPRPELIAEPRTDQQPSESEKTPSPTVQVTIGRVEVRAAPPPPAPLKRPPSRSQPEATLSLDDYLRQRSEGRR